ncbi:MAG: hypothetical protein K9I99_17845 [Melioribacteraceae bacterium]|nr:hypothetical protein [Melioribacteraceae bacterium]
MKKLVAELSFDKQMLQDFIKKSSNASSKAVVDRIYCAQLSSPHPQMLSPGNIVFKGIVLQTQFNRRHAPENADKGNCFSHDQI